MAEEDPEEHLEILALWVSTAETRLNDRIRVGPGPERIPFLELEQVRLSSDIATLQANLGPLQTALKDQVVRK